MALAWALYGAGDVLLITSLILMFRFVSTPRILVFLAGAGCILTAIVIAARLPLT